MTRYIRNRNLPLTSPCKQDVKANGIYAGPKIAHPHISESHKAGCIYCSKQSTPPPPQPPTPTNLYGARCRAMPWK